MRTQQVYVGVDVSKAHLDVARHDDEEVWRVSNDEEGIDELVSRLVDLPPRARRLGSYGRLNVLR